MIIIDVSGSNKKKRDMVEDLTMFCLKNLMPKMSKIIINIELISGLNKKEGLIGSCIWEDSIHLPREFTIKLDSTQKIKEILKTLAHEMVHIKQYARGELKDLAYGDSICKWHDKFIRYDKLNYYDHPWEIEAYGREYGLVIRWAYKCKWSKEVLEYFKM
jgi:hypothetical protein